MKRILSVVVVLCLLCLCACAPAATTPTTTVPTTTTTTVAEATTTVTSATIPTTTAANTTTAKPYYTTVIYRPTLTTTTTTATTTTTTRVTTTTKPQTPVLRVLSIGNSYSMDAHHFLSSLAAHEGREIRTVNLYYSGCTLEKHYRFYQNNEAAYQYEVNGKIDWNTHVTLLDILKSEPWDVVTFQEASYASCTGNSVQPYLNSLIDVVRTHAPQAKLYLHQTWAYADGYSSHNSTTGGSMAAMWQKVKITYDVAAAETGLPIIPSGLAMFNAQQAFNERGLGESIQRDGAHADESWGRYLLALVWYKTLTGKTPSNTFENFDGFYLPDDTVRAMIHKTAMDAVAVYT